MSDFTFRGFPVGSAVSISAVQGAANASNAVASWGQANMGTVGIQVTNHGAMHAPAAVWLKATDPTGFDVGEVTGDNYDPTYHEITYVWTIRGQPLSPFSAPQNMVAGWNNPNVMYGKHVAFYLPSAGIYDIDLWCVDGGGNTAEATTQVTVTTPSYAASDTIVVALDGDFTGAPESTARVTSVAAAQSALTGRTRPTRISFKPGETHNAFRIEQSVGRLEYVDTWTVGQKVTLNLMPHPGDAPGGFANGFDEGAMTQQTFRDLIMDGGWDPTSETGYRESGAFAWARIPQRCDFMVADCEFRGLVFLGATLRDYGGVTGCRAVLANTVIEDWQGYGIGFWPNGDSRAFLAFLGLRIKQNPAALGGGPKTGMQNDHGCVRIGNAQHLIISQCDTFTTSGWSGWPPPANANLRLLSSVFPDSSSIVERNVVEGGYTKIKIDGQNDGQAEYGGNHLIERNLLLGTARTFFFISAHYGGTTIRNNLAYMPDVPLFDGISGDFLALEPDNPQASNQRPMRVYNNSFVSNESGNTRAFWGAGNPPTYFSDYTFENNISYRLGGTSDGPLDLSTPLSGITPRYAQVRFNFEMYVTTLAADVPNGGSVTIPFAAFDRSTGFTHPVLVTGSTAPTDQAYWQAIAVAGDDLHMMRVNGGPVQYAALGQFTVDYDSDPNNVVITNTSGSTWSAGQWEVRLDRKSQLDIELPPATVYASPSTIPTCAPLTAPGPGETRGELAYHDFFGTTRTQPVASGAIED